MASYAAWLALIIRDVATALLVGVLLVAVLPALWGWRSTVVMSGSMSPGIRPGDVVVITPATYAASGTVILVDNPAKPGHLLLHRLVLHRSDGSMITKGDANQTRDSTPVPPAGLRGIARLRIPAVGLPSVWMQNHHYLPIAGTVLFLATLLLPRSRRKHPPVLPAGLNPQPTPAEPDIRVSTTSELPRHANQ